MTKDTTRAARDGDARTKAASSKPGVPTTAAPEPKIAGLKAAKPKTNKPKASMAKSAKPKADKAKPSANTAPTKAAVKKAAKAVTKAASKQKGSAKPGENVQVKPAPAVKTVAAPSTKQAKHTKGAAPATPTLGLSLQATVPAAVAVNTKLVDIAHSNVSAGLELARDLAGAKTPLEAMHLGVSFWFNHIGAVHAQARELQSLSAAWVRTASAQVRTP